MKTLQKMLALSSLYLLLWGCATAQNQNPNQALAKELAYCGWLANNLAKSDPKYDEPSTVFTGIAAGLTSREFVMQALMDDNRAMQVDNMQRAGKENEFSRCQSLVKANWNQISAALAQANARQQKQ